MDVEPARTMAAWVHGRAVPRAGGVDHDAYSLFYERSAELGYLTDALRPSPPRAWGMNDAVVDPSPGRDVGQVGWFQVVVTDPSAVPPVQPFLACVNDVVDRLVDLEIELVQVLLPSPGNAQVEAAGWAAEAQLRAASESLGRRADGTSIGVRADVDAGTGSTLARAAMAIVDGARSLSPIVFEIAESHYADLDASVAGPANLIDGTWGGPPRQRLTVEGAMGAWSLPVIGGLAAMLAFGCITVGVTTPVLLSIQRR